MSASPPMLLPVTPTHETSAHLADGRPRVPPLQRLLNVGPEPRHPYLYALAVVAVATLIAFALYPFEDLANLIMVYLLATVIAAVRLGRGPSITTTIVGTAAFVYFFVPNRYSFVMADLTYLQTFTIMIVVGIIVSTLTSQLRAELLATEARGRRSRALYELSRALTGGETLDQLRTIVGQHVELAFRARGLLLPVPPREATTGHGEAPLLQLSVADLTAAERACTTKAPERTGALHLQPLVVANEAVGVLACELIEPTAITNRDDVQLVESFANNIAVALHRVLADERVKRAHQRAEEERLRNVMLSSVSHDLRTPLAAITGAVTTLIDDGARLDEATRQDLQESIRDDADALERHVRNLLDLTRLESGGLQARVDWCSLEEVVGCALRRVDSLLAGRTVDVALPSDLPLVRVDGTLLEQLLVNLLENAARYTPKGSPLRIEAGVHGERLRLVVADRGPGIPADEREHVFTKFYRGEGHRHATGAGLGLAICRAIAHLHGGDILVQDRDGGGAAFVTTLPTGGQQPTSPEDREDSA